MGVKQEDTHPILGHIYRLAEEVGGHVRDEHARHDGVALRVTGSEPRVKQLAWCALAHTLNSTPWMVSFAQMCTNAVPGVSFQLSCAGMSARQC